MYLKRLGGLIVAASTTAAAIAGVSVLTASSAAASTTCVTANSGVNAVLSYTGTHADGSTVTAPLLSGVASPGTSVVARVKVTHLPAGATCVNLALATYRSETVRYNEFGYQLLYQSATATNVHLGDTVTLTVLVPQTPGTPGPGCTNTHTLAQNGNGANVPGPYDTTCDGTASGNGQGNGAAKGKTCAGCVGNADNKNPPGQQPGPQDANAGYECDTNKGIAKGNPAHSGCAVGVFWQVDLVTGPVLPYVGTAPSGGVSQSYGANPWDTKRLLDSWHS
ncbi:MAG: hypothetical protein QOJ11_2722 [Frankiales bacterium]|jgi:hypothetical protein|nr:hypothetical protein [Frankiales bacterium]